MHSVGFRGFFRLLALTWFPLLAACGDGAEHSHDEPHEHADSLFVAHAGRLVAYALESGEERPGELQKVDGPVDMQALEDGRLLVNLSSRNEVIVVDGKSMLELARIESSALGAVNPVHGYISPERNGRRYWLALNDGDGSRSSDSAAFIDIQRASATAHERVGEIALGIGHHKGAFSTARERVVLSNIADCDDVISVFDYSDIENVERVATLSAEDAGYDGSSFTTTCDPTYQNGLPPAPHGCAASAHSGKVYCGVTGNGQIAVVDVDADEPSFDFIQTNGGGGGYTRTTPGGRYVYSLQAEPRGGCQVGQLAVIDTETDTLANEVPLLYDGPGCERELEGTDEESTEPAHLVIHGDRLFITLAGGYMVPGARVRRELVLDLSDPREPEQLPSVELGTSTGYHGGALSADGERLFVANNLDGSVTEIDPRSSKVVRTLQVRERPEVLATWQEHEGPGHQTGPIE